MQSNLIPQHSFVGAVCKPPLQKAFLLLGLLLAACSPAADAAISATTTFTPEPTLVPTESPTYSAVVAEAVSATKQELKIYTQAELEAMVPTREEMIAFLNSDEIDRVEESNGELVPLGFEPVTTRFEFYLTNLNAIAWDKPFLAEVDIDGETVKTMLVPALIIQNGDYLNPIFLYVAAGDEGEFGISADIAFSEDSTSGRGIETVEEFSWYIQRGRQFKAQMAFEAKDEIGYQNLNPNFPSYENFLRRFGEYFRKIAEKIIGGQGVEQGIVVGAPALFSFQGVPHPIP